MKEQKGPSPEQEAVRERLRKSGVSVLLCGGSGTGKTSYLLSWCQQLGSKNNFLVGGDLEDFASLTDAPSPAHFSSNFKGLSENSTVIVDDLFSLSRSDHESLRFLLCYAKRHQGVNIGVATHTLNYTGIKGLFSLFDLVVFTQTTTGAKDFRYFLSQFPLEGLSVEHFFAIPKFGYLRIDMKSQTYEYGKDTKSQNISAQEKTIEEKLRGIDDILRVFPEKYTRMRCHLAHILQNMDPSLIAPNDYTIDLSAKKGAEKKIHSVSLVDYLLACQDEEETEIPFPLLLLHRYLSDSFNTPLYLLQNKELKTFWQQQQQQQR